MAKYEGILAKKDEIPDIAIGVTPEIIGYEKYAKAREDALFNHFGIPRTVGVDGELIPDWKDLALSLAEAHVPAYSKNQGRPYKNWSEDFKWYRMYLAYKARDDCNDRTSYKKISEREDIVLSADQIKDRLKSFCRKRPSDKEYLEKSFQPISRTERAVESAIYHALKVRDPRAVEVDAMERYQQQYTRFPYGPPERYY